MADAISQDTIRELARDADWLRQEAEALQQVIETIPYDQSVPGERTFRQKLEMFDELQATCYQPVFEAAASGGDSRIHAERPEQERADQSPESESGRDIRDLLSRLAARRSSLVAIIRNLPPDQWGREVAADRQPFSLAGFAREMILKDREWLRELGELVRIFQQETRTRREIEGQAASGNHAVQNDRG